MRWKRMRRPASTVERSAISAMALRRCPHLWNSLLCPSILIISWFLSPFFDWYGLSAWHFWDFSVIPWFLGFSLPKACPLQLWCWVCRRFDTVQSCPGHNCWETKKSSCFYFYWLFALALVPIWNLNTECSWIPKRRIIISSLCLVCSLECPHCGLPDKRHLLWTD